MKKIGLLSLLGIGFFMASCSKAPELTLVCHAALKIKTAEGKVIYIDPYKKGDYSEPADLILITHGHDDHNNVKSVTAKSDTQIITYSDLHPDINTYNETEKLGVKIRAVPAYNKNHAKNSCVGYILEFDGFKIYHAGDTDFIEEMKALSSENIDYAFIPTDGFFNMGLEEATKAANAIGAKHTVAIHNNGTNFAKCKTQDELFQKFTPENRLYMNYGDKIKLKK